MIRREDKGPVFYRGLRVGLHGRDFRIFKFRSMVIDAEKIGASSTSDDDARITKIGKILRKYKIDELPQLLNVLKGDMSFVGPRPEVRKFVDMYTESEKVLLELRPGITDYASLWNSAEGELLAGSLDPDKDYLEKIRPEKIRLQLKYAESHNLITDTSIILKTVFKILLRE
jgi:lipopolysaccharide/colanic/teichoic acid biosynthesis glycosyltransferase